MGANSSVPLPGPSLSYVRSCAEIDAITPWSGNLFDYGQQQNVRRVINCSDPTKGSDFVLKFDALKIPTVNLVDGIISFKLLKNGKEIINSQILFGFYQGKTYQQFLVNIPEDWISAISPRDYVISGAIVKPTGTVWLQSPNNDLFFFDFFLTNSSTEIKVDFRSIGYYVNNPFDLSTDPGNNCQVLSNKNDDLFLEIRSQSDALGLNITEISAIVTAQKKYPNGIPDELVGYCRQLLPQQTDFIQTLYSFNPNLRKVLKLEGNSLLDQTNNINKEFNNVDITENVKNCEFYKRIIFYSSVRYYLGGLSNNGKFSCKWLYANNYAKFLRNLENSDFHEGIVIFTDPCYGYVDFNKYFRSCEHHH